MYWRDKANTGRAEAKAAIGSESETDIETRYLLCRGLVELD
jgi:hypothetical protein